MRRTDALLLLGLLVLPVGIQWGVGDAVIGLESDDLSGHLWTLWNATRGPMTSTELVNAPSGVDLMPIVGGWLDIRLGSWLAPWLGVAGAYNAVLSLYLLLAGVGGFLLARALGARTGGGVLAGVLLQLDPFILLHLGAGRPEQASLGLVAMALAGALGAWRTGDRWWVLLAGLSGAAVIFASWELAALLAVGMVLLLPVVMLGLPAAVGAGRRWLLAAGITVAMAGPWVAWFLHRTVQIRETGAASHGLDIAAHASIGWLQFWMANGGNPGLVPTLTLLALPVLDRPWRRFWLGLWGILALAFVFALGPFPAAMPGGTHHGITGPFAWLQHLPIAGWFHWPDRVVCVWGLVGASATGYAATRLADRPQRRWATALVFLALSLALLRIQQARLWPQARFQLPTSPLWDTLRNDPRPGALFDLPVRMKGIAGYAPGLAQMHHQRAVRSYGGVPWLLGPPAREPRPPITFSLKLDPRQAVPSIRVTDAEVETLRADGFGFIVLQKPRTSTQWFLAAERALTAELGAPLGRDNQVGWVVWALPADAPVEKAEEQGVRDPD